MSGITSRLPQAAVMMVLAGEPVCLPLGSSHCPASGCGNLELGPSSSQIRGSARARRPIPQQDQAPPGCCCCEMQEAPTATGQLDSPPRPLSLPGSKGPAWRESEEGKHQEDAASLLPTDAFPVPSSGKHFWPTQLLCVR